MNVYGYGTVSTVVNYLTRNKSRSEVDWFTMYLFQYGKIRKYGKLIRKNRIKKTGERCYLLRLIEIR